MLINFSEILTQNIRRVAVVGHTHPDGDCTGSVTAVCFYLADNYPEITAEAYLEEPTDGLKFLTEGLKIREDDGKGEDYDLVIAVDSSDVGRIGAGKEAFLAASVCGKTVCIDHHETNTGYAAVSHVEPDASSTAEVLIGLFDMSRIGLTTAQSLYTGIIHDTGVFSYDCTSPRTLRFCAALLEKNVPAAKIIENSWTEKPLQELRIASEMVLTGTLIPEERFFYALCPIEKSAEFGLGSRELGGVVAELTNTKEADVILFVYQYEDGTWKGSLRAKCDVNVSKIAFLFGGGGHRKAAGFSFSSDPGEMIARVRGYVRQLRMGEEIGL